jgi:hypothetical protein
LNKSVSNMETAYTDAVWRINNDPERINLGGGMLDGVYGDENHPLAPGVYTFGSGVLIASNIHFNGGANDLIIIQMTGRLTQFANTKAGREECRGARRCAPGGHPFGQDRRYVRDFVLTVRPRPGTDGVNPHGDNYHSPQQLSAPLTLMNGD